MKRIFLFSILLMAQKSPDSPASSSNRIEEELQTEQLDTMENEQEENSNSDLMTDEKDRPELKRRATDALIGLFWESYGDDDSKKVAKIEQKVRLGDSTEPVSEYRYASFYQADPFSIPKATILEKKVEIPVTSQLQRYDTKNLAVRGIWQTSQGSQKALILAPDNLAVVAKIGDSVGRRGGRITEIESDRVIIREFYFSDQGTRQFQDVSIWIGGENPNEKEKSLEFSSQVALESMDGLGFLERKEILERKELQKVEKKRDSENNTKQNSQSVQVQQQQIDFEKIQDDLTAVQ